MHWLYSNLLRIALPLFFARLMWRGLTNRPYWANWRERLGFSEVVPSTSVRVWFHAVSVGEAQAAVPVIKALFERAPHLDILVTTTTPTGRARIRSVLGQRVGLVYLPYDVPGAVARFLDRADPQVAVIMETELWPNLIQACGDRSVPVVLANARLSARSASGYHRYARITRPALAGITLGLAQTQDDGSRLVDVGLPAEHLAVTGSVKFDVRLPPSVREAGAALRRRWGSDRGIFIAASTHEGEESILLDAFKQLLVALPDTLLVLVPRHPERFSRVATLCKRKGLTVARHSETPASCLDAHVYLGDTMGDLPALYAGADVAFVGGSLVDVGGHNVLEPAALGLPVLVGPYVRNFDDITARLVETGAARFVVDSDTLRASALEWLRDANVRHASGVLGARYVEANRGALDATVAAIAGLIPNLDKD
jgi:3-deoxy-D-manno-octulosonic-acid transferase